MTKSAIEIAIEALNKASSLNATETVTHFYIDEALAVLSIEPVPEEDWAALAVDLRKELSLPVNADRHEITVAVWNLLRSAEQSRVPPEPADYHERHQVSEMDAASLVRSSLVPPDREQVAKELINEYTNYINNDAENFDPSVMSKAAALFRQPAPAEIIPSGIAGLIADIRTKGGLITCPDMLDFLNIVERALARSQPAPAEVNTMAVLADNHAADCLIKSTNENLPNWTRNVFENHAKHFSDLASFIRRFVLPAVGDWRDIASAPKSDEVLCLLGHIANGKLYWAEAGIWNGLSWYTPSGDAIHRATHWTTLSAPPITEELDRRLAPEYDHGMRFGPSYEKPCNNPLVIECSYSKCQALGRCYLPASSPEEPSR